MKLKLHLTKSHPTFTLFKIKNLKQLFISKVRIKE